MERFVSSVTGNLCRAQQGGGALGEYRDRELLQGATGGVDLFIF